MCFVNRSAKENLRNRNHIARKKGKRKKETTCGPRGLSLTRQASRRKKYYINLLAEFRTKGGWPKNAPQAMRSVPSPKNLVN